MYLVRETTFKRDIGSGHIRFHQAMTRFFNAASSDVLMESCADIPFEQASKLVRPHPYQLCDRFDEYTVMQILIDICNGLVKGLVLELPGCRMGGEGSAIEYFDSTHDASDRERYSESIIDDFPPTSSFSMTAREIYSINLSSTDT